MTHASAKVGTSDGDSLREGKRNYLPIVKKKFTHLGIPYRLKAFADGMKRTISTIGYEGTTIEQFVVALRHASVDLLIDVRDIPLSRKKGFSKNQLDEILRSWDIEYVHLRGLGDPKEGREAARAGNYALFEKIFGKHMGSDVAERDLNTAAALVKGHRACLMCFEADYEKCHRSIVADHLSRITGLTVTPLAIQDARVGRIAA